MRYFAPKQNQYQYKVVAYGGWSLTGSGSNERVDCSFEFYLPQRQKHNATDRPY